MKKALGVLELLIVQIIIIVVYFTCFSNGSKNLNPFDDNARVQTQKEIVNDKIKDIENTKAIKERIENNLREGY